MNDSSAYFAFLIVTGEESRCAFFSFSLSLPKSPSSPKLPFDPCPSSGLTLSWPRGAGAFFVFIIVAFVCRDVKLCAFKENLCQRRSMELVTIRDERKKPGLWKQIPVTALIQVGLSAGQDYIVIVPK